MTLDTLCVPLRPHHAYKQDLLCLARERAPASVLDVGCGGGAFLHELNDLGCPRCVGLEVEPTQVATLRSQGLDAIAGRAEALPFDDASFDLVVFDYVAHHIEHLDQALREAARVARRSVVVLEPWYDLALASQRTACAFDEWLKVIDRRVGMVHNPCASANELAPPLVELGFAIDYRQRLILQPLSIDRLEELAAKQLAQIRHDPCLLAELQVIRESAYRDGLSDDGSILLQAHRLD